MNIPRKRGAYAKGEMELLAVCTRISSRHRMTRLQPLAYAQSEVGAFEFEFMEQSLV